MSDVQEEFRAELAERLEAAGHRLGVSKYHGSMNINGAHVRVEVSMARSRAGDPWSRPPPRIASIVIGGGEYRGRPGQRFNTRKAGWDWDALVKECVEESARQHEKTKSEREARKKTEALEDHPDTKRAAKLGVGLIDVEHGGLSMRLYGLTPATALAVAKLVKERS